VRTAISLDDADNEGFNVPAIPPATSQPQPVAPPKPDAGAEKFPATYSDSIALLRQIDAQIGQTPGGPELRGLQARHERLRRHIFDLQQGPSAPSHLDHLSAQREWVQSSARTERLIALADYSGDAQAKKELDAIRAASVRQEAKRPARTLGKGCRDRI